jgi:superoxide reductase
MWTAALKWAVCMFHRQKRRNEMTTKSEVFKCAACGAIVAVITGGKGELVCCDQKMVEVTPDKAKKLIHGMARPGTP